MVFFQILDCYSQDLKVINETETTKEVSYIYNDDDGEYNVKSRSQIPYENKHEFVIHLFGKTNTNKYIRVSVENFKPFFYVELPSNIHSTYSKFIQQLKSAIRNDKLFESIITEKVEKEKLYGYTNKTKFPFVKISVSSLMLFRKLKNIFLDEKNAAKFMFNDSILKVYEANLDPMLRFFHVQNISPCGWVQIDCDYNEQIEVSYEDVLPLNNPPNSVAPFLYGFWDIECYSASGDFPLTKRDYSKIAKQLYENTKTTEEAVIALKECFINPENPAKGFDGIVLKKEKTQSEIYTILNDKKFQTNLTSLYSNKETTNKENFITQATKILNSLNISLPIAGDPVIQIGIVFTQNNCITEKHIFVLNSCDLIDGSIVHTYKDEASMILGFFELIDSKNPDILVGYNVFGFDMKYLYERMEELNITEDEHFQNMNRIIDLCNTNGKELPVHLQKKFLSSSALGDNNLFIWSTTGRLHIDLYFYIKRNENLASYKLDDVCRYYMSGKLKEIDISNENFWKINTKSTSDAEIGKYIVLLDEIGDTIVDKCKIIGIEHGKYIMVNSPPDYFDTEDLKTIVSWAIVKDDVSPAEIFKLHREGGSEGRCIVAKYCIQDCILVQQLFNKLDVFNNAMAMANTCSVPVGYIFTRGQGIKCESLIFKECAQRNQLIEVLLNPIQKTDDDYNDESYEGAIVLVPEPKFHLGSPIGVADFASLYPSSIISENLSYDTLLWTKDYDNSYKFICYSFGSEQSEKYLQEGIAFTDIEFDIWAPDPNDTRKNPEKIKTGIRICRYVQQANDMKGTLPDILTKLLAARKAKRKEAEKETDVFRKALLDAEQLAYKLTANSLYGQLGSSTFKVRLQHLAASTTAYGRKQIMFAKDAIETFYGKEANDPRCAATTVYGDTDSLFINFNVKNSETGEILKGKEAIEATMALTEEAGKFVTRCLKKPHDFEYDKVFYPFIIFSKKRYVGNKYEDSSENYKQTSMGIATKRRDYAGIVKNVYGGAIKILLNEANIQKAYNFVQKVCNDLVDGKISDHQLTLTKSLRSEYKTVTLPAHKMLADRIALRDPGNAPSSGERMQFMYVLPPVGQVESKLQGDRIETPSYIKEQGLKIDYKYYIQHQIYNPISQLFALFVDQLPGYVKPKHAMSIEEKEDYAGKLLFNSIYAKCDKSNVRSFAEKFNFQVTKVDKPEKPNKAIPMILAPKPKRKEEINTMKMDMYLIKMNNEKKDKKKSEKTLVVEV